MAAFANGQVDKYELSEKAKEYGNHESEDFGFYIQKGLFEEYAGFGRGKAHDLAPFDTYHEVRGLRWPVAGLRGAVCSAVLSFARRTDP